MNQDIFVLINPACGSVDIEDTFDFPLTPGHKNLEEAFRNIFLDSSRMPLQKVTTFEPIEHLQYDSAYRIGLNLQNSCQELYSSCPISLLQVLLNLEHERR